ncbi:MAG: hypothetical protein HC768_17850 [Acaryochloris sp. CRU_2_0]|nr:hypothetical protein [Acaryochloris sp. CRU_2_0]
MNIQDETRNTLTTRRQQEGHVRESMLNRSLEELDDPMDTQLQEEARARLVAERQDEQHTQALMRERVAEEIDGSLGL